MKFKILINDGLITEKTIIKRNGVIVHLKTPLDICKFIKKIWCKDTGVKSFTQWAKELNEEGEYGTGYTKYDALDNLASSFTLNISGKHVNLYDFFTEHMPFKVN